MKMIDTTPKKEYKYFMPQLLHGKHILSRQNNSDIICSNIPGAQSRETGDKL